MEEIQQIKTTLERIERILSSNQSPWKTIPEAADYLRVSVSTVRRICENGKLQFKPLSPDKMRSKILIHINWLDKYIMFNSTGRLNSLQRSEIKALRK